MTTNLLRKSLLSIAAAVTLVTSTIAFAGSASADPHFVRWGHRENHEHFDHFRFGHRGCWRLTWHGWANVCRW
jgi:hypothetical protein